jgi:hypothetical protein
MLWVALGDYRGPSRIRAFSRYALSRYTNRVFDKAWMTYVADSVNLYGCGKTMSVTFSQLVSGATTDDRTAEEIADDVIRRLEGSD